MRECLKCLNKESLYVLHEGTRSLTLEGMLMTKGQVNLSEAYLSNIVKVCPEIRTLRLHNVCFDEEILFDHLPSSLTKLSIIESEFGLEKLPDSYFNNIHTKLPNLQELNLTDCEWVTDYFLLEICKIETLKVLSIYEDNDVTKITRRGIKYITEKGASNIERLTLVNFHLCDWLLIKMASEMKRLKYLHVRNSYGVTTEGVKLFKSIVESRPPGASQFCEILF